MLQEKCDIHILETDHTRRVERTAIVTCTTQEGSDQAGTLSLTIEHLRGPIESVQGFYNNTLILNLYYLKVVLNEFLILQLSFVITLFNINNIEFCNM